MKLKYYLRGLGMGIIFATLIMTISSVIHNNNLSEETIIKEAEKLGMVMPEEESESGLWADKKDEVSDTEELDTEKAEEVVKGTETETTETHTEATETETATTETKEPQTTVNTNVTMIKIQVYPGDAARQVAETLQANGLIEDSEDFRLYLGRTGYAKNICIGEFLIPMGATYEEICDILISK